MFAILHKSEYFVVCVCFAVSCWFAFIWDFSFENFIITAERILMDPFCVSIKIRR